MSKDKTNITSVEPKYLRTDEPTVETKDNYRKRTGYFELELGENDGELLRAVKENTRPKQPPETVGAYLAEQFEWLRKLTVDHNREFMVVLGVNGSSREYVVMGEVLSQATNSVHLPSYGVVPVEGEIIMITHSHPDSEDSYPEGFSSGDFRALRFDPDAWNCVVSPQGVYLITARYSKNKKLRRSSIGEIDGVSFDYEYDLLRKPSIYDDESGIESVVLPSATIPTNASEIDLRRLKAAVLVAQKYDLEYYYVDQEGQITVLNSALSADDV